MTLPLPTTVGDPATQQCLDRLAEQFPIQPQNVANSLKGTNVEGVEKLRTVRGIIATTTPTIVKGSGFTIGKNTTGTVTITFASEFTDVPSVTATPISGGEGRAISISEVTKAKVKLVVFKVLSATEIEGEFHFNAIGPR